MRRMKNQHLSPGGEDPFVRDTLTILHQIRGSLAAEVAPEISFTPAKILIIGMGGSAICGDILADMLRSVSPIPITVIRAMEVPHWVDASTLVIAISYSGDTLEALTATEDARAHGASICGISSGGRLAKYCTEHGIPHFRLPGGMMPRAALGSMLGACARCISSEKIPSTEILVNAVNECEPISEKIIAGEYPLIESIAKRIAHTTPVIYATASILSAARRFKSQINENAKTLAHVSEFPESAHNEIVGLKDLISQKKDTHISLFALRLKKEDEYIRRMYEAFESVVGKRFFNITSPFEGVPSSILYYILVGDAVTLRLAEIRGVDPSKIEAITEFKRHLWF